MSWFCLFLALLCGIVLVLKIATGTLEPVQVAGAAIILICAAVALEWNPPQITLRRPRE